MDGIVFALLVLLFSAVIHEVAHGSIAMMLGDPTAKESGRLTLNPLPHLDPVGSFLVPFFLLIISGGQGPIFGWARPVPINPYNLRKPRWDMAKVAVAGAGANFALALVFSMVLRFFAIPENLAAFLSMVIVLNLLLGIFNLVPIPPLDGSKVLFAVIPDRFWQFRVLLEQYGVFLLLLFLFFRGIPFIQPLVFWIYSLFTGFPVSL